MVSISSKIIINLYKFAIDKLICSYSYTRINEGQMFKKKTHKIVIYWFLRNYVIIIVFYVLINCSVVV